MIDNLQPLFFVAKNEYGWGPPSSTFTFYNKGIGKFTMKKYKLFIFYTS